MLKQAGGKKESSAEHYDFSEIVRTYQLIFFSCSSSFEGTSYSFEPLSVYGVPPNETYRTDIHNCLRDDIHDR